MNVGRADTQAFAHMPRNRASSRYLTGKRWEVLLSKQATKRGYLITRLNLHHAYALGVSTQRWDVIEGGPYYYTFGGYEHNTLTGVNNGCSYDFACLLYYLESPHAAAAPRLKGVSIEGRAFAEAIGADYEEMSIGVNNIHSDHTVVCGNSDAPHTATGSGSSPQVGDSELD